MKFTITFKDPDTVSDAIRDAAKQEVSQIVGLKSERERENLIETRCEDITAVTEKWIEYGEYLRVEIDTEAQTARILERK
ncbi:MAG TPA: hypothetical protein VER11_34305 [Polyangiaceae bacterium]|nr:hypothetical protein [Polyangiaceae bacterium]